MALIVDPDDLSQGLETAVADGAFTSSSGSSTTITGSATLPTLAAGDFFEVRDHSTAGNNGLYIATGSPTSSSLPCTKVDGTNPANAASEAIRILGDNGSATEYKSVHIDTEQKRVYLLEKGNLSTDGVTLQCLYSFLKEEWKADADLIQNAFPIVSVTPEQFEFSDDWEPRDTSSPDPDIQSKKLIRTAGWSEVAAAGYIQDQYMGAITLGTFEDNANDLAYYQLGTDPTDTTAAIDFTFAGPVNESVLVYHDIGVPGDIAVSGTDTITSASSSFIADGFRVGGSVTIQTAEDAGNDGTWPLLAVTATTLQVSGTLTNNAADSTMRLAVDNRNAVTLRLRIRDADPNGKTFDQAALADIGFSAVDNKAFRFPLANATDLQISATDAALSGSPWSEVRLRYLPETFNIPVDSATQRNYGIVIDVGTYSRGNGTSNSTTLFTSVGQVDTGSGEALTDYTGGTLTIHEGADEGTHTISGTPVDNSGTLEITLTVALTGSASNLSFTMDRATPLTADQNEVYEKVQYLLRQDADIDSTSSVVTGRTADELIDFVASNDVRFGDNSPTNPNGGGTGVILVGFDPNDTNNYSFYDSGGVARTYPFVAAGSITFNANLTGDTAPEYWMFYTYTTQTAVADGSVTAPSGSTYTITSSGNLPALSVNDFIKVAGFAQSANNGLFVVTVVNSSTSSYDIRRIDGGSVGTAESTVAITVDQNPIDTPQAIIVQDNSAADISGSAASSPATFTFDYDNNVQGGRTAATNAAVTIRAIGLEEAQFAEVTGTITRSTGLSFSVVAALERNYSNP